MRLGQLARKLAVRPVEIVSFLATHKIALDDGSNTRLEDDHVALVIKQFGPGLSVEAPIAEELAEEVIATGPILPPETVELREVNPVASDPLLVEGKQAEEKIEVIKAPKVELSGLKVLGKIDLPEPKKKDAPLQDATGQNAENPSAEPRRKAPLKKEKPDHRTRKNPIALQRDRETQEAERKRQARQEQEKEQRTKNYYKRVQVSAPTKRVKLVEEPTTEMSADELKEAPRSLLGKFFKWLKS